MGILPWAFQQTQRITWPKSHSLPWLHHSRYQVQSHLCLLSRPASNQLPGPVTAPCMVSLSKAVGLYLCMCISFSEEKTHSLGSKLQGCIGKAPLSCPLSPTLPLPTISLAYYCVISQSCWMRFQRQRNTYPFPTFFTRTAANHAQLYSSSLLLFHFMYLGDLSKPVPKSACIFSYGHVVFYVPNPLGK